MSEQTKGKLEVRAYMSPPNKYRIADKNGETILSDASPEVFKGKKGKELLSRICQCVNAFEPGGSHSKLLEACNDILTYEDELFDIILDGDLGCVKSGQLKVILDRLRAIAQAEVK